MLWVPGNATRTTACSDATCGASSRGDLVAGGDELSGSAEPVVRGKNRHQGEGGSVRGLTAMAMECSARSGTARSRRIRRRRPAGPKRGRTAGRRLGASPVA